MTNLVFIIALTLFHEAGGEGERGQRAVASVAWNRAHGRPSELVADALAPRQFSCWNRGGTARRIAAGTAKRPSGPAWERAKALAREMAAGTFKPTGPWTHYHALTVRPRWSRGMAGVKVIGGHKFGRTR